MGGQSFGRPGWWESFRRWWTMYRAPTLLFVLGVVVYLVSTFLAHWPTLARLGFALAVVGLLWAIAKGFSLSTLRVSTLLAVLLTGLLISHIGRDSRDEKELATYETTRRQLDIDVEQIRAEQPAAMAAAADDGADDEDDEAETPEIELSFPGLTSDQVADVLNEIQGENDSSEPDQTGGDVAEQEAQAASAEAESAEKAAVTARDAAVESCLAAETANGDAKRSATEATNALEMIKAGDDDETTRLRREAREHVDDAFEAAAKATGAADEAEVAAVEARDALGRATAAAGEDPRERGATEDDPSCSSASRAARSVQTVRSEVQRLQEQATELRDDPELEEGTRLVLDTALTDLEQIDTAIDVLVDDFFGVLSTARDDLDAGLAEQEMELAKVEAVVTGVAAESDTTGDGDAGASTEPADQQANQDVEDALADAAESVVAARQASTEADDAAAAADRIAAEARESADAAYESLAAVEGCGGLLDDESTLIGYNEAVRCGTAITSGCRETDRDPERCKPRTASRLLYSGYLIELTEPARPTDADAAADLDERIKEAEDKLNEDLQKPVPLVDLVTSGADDLVTEAAKPVTNNDIPSGLAGLGWVLVALLAIFVYRSLEIANDARRPGPVEVKSDDESKELVQLFRAHLAAVELSEPSPVPGGEAISAATTELKGEGAQGAAINFVVAVLQKTLFPANGVEIEVSQRAPAVAKNKGSDADEKTADDSKEATGDASKVEVSVRGYVARNNALLFAERFEGDTLDDAVEQAAHYAAVQVLSRGYTTPGWLRWRADSGYGLRSYQAAMHGPTGGEDDHDVGRLLEAAVSSNPSTGVALVALSNERAIEGRLVESAILAKFAVDREPRYLAAQYRLGATLSMIAGDLDNHWTYDVRREELQTLLGMGAGVVADPGKQLAKCASAALEKVKQDLGGLTVLRRALIRQRERSYWLRLLRSPERKGFELTAESAKHLADYRNDRNQRNDQIDRTLKDVAYDDAGVLYNAACYYSVRAHDTASDFDKPSQLLRQARMARGGPTVTATWAKADPDLRHLRDDPGTAWDDVEAQLEALDRWRKPETNEEDDG